MVDRRVRPGRGPYARRDRHDDCDDQSEQRQFERRRQALHQIAHHRLTGGERVAEIAVREIAEIVQELHQQALVEPQLGADLGDRGGVGGRPGEIGCRVAGQRVR